MKNLALLYSVSNMVLGSRQDIRIANVSYGKKPKFETYVVLTIKITI